MTKKRWQERITQWNIGRAHLTRKDVLALEDIIMKHMIVMNDKRQAHYKNRQDVTEDERKAAKFYDFYVQVGGRNLGIFSFTRDPFEYNHTEDSVSKLPKYIKRVRFLKIVGHPGITLTFTPRKTILYAQTNYAVGMELQSMNQCIRRIGSYLARRRKKNYTFNLIEL